mgnify:CR=1 FL=1
MSNKRKHQHGYATFSDGKGFREIADILAEEGLTKRKMRHTSIRNYYLRAMETLAEPVSKYSGRPVRDIARDPRFQLALYEILRGHNNDIDF